MKRKRAGNDAEAATPKKARVEGQEDESEDESEDEIAVAAVGQDTPSRRSITKQSARDLRTAKINAATNGSATDFSTPKSHRKVLFSTPNKPHENGSANGTPTVVRNADRSARRKSARRLIQRTITGGPQSEEEEEEDVLAEQILDEEDGEDIAEDENGLVDEDTLPETPSKRARGRPKGKRKRRSPTPPQNLPPHELYFYQNRPGGSKTSNNTLPSNLLLNHEEYFAQMQSYEDPHQEEMEFLLSLHSGSFDQWVFELECGFNICLYGYGSKRGLTQKFAEHLYHASSTPRKIVIVNGYAPNITVRDILTALASVLFPHSTKLPADPSAFLQLILSAIANDPPKPNLTVVVNSIDASSLRRPTAQSILAQLAASPHVSIVATADTPNFPLLWDLSLRSQFRFLFHDCTTFAPYDAEIDVVESVNELLGRSGRRVGGRDGVGYVLRSLPENARSLFRILVAEQLAASSEDEGLDGVGDSEDAEAETPQTPRRSKQGAAAADVGVEYRVLYHKAVEEFVCSNEMNFRTLLKEFHDHQMVESRRDALGTERLWVPFRREELEGLLEELVI